MKKPTGPGKIQTSLTAPGTPVSGVIALLFNFDFDDATVKPEHQAWLLENLVPPLTAAPDQRVSLRGTASQVGNADYNLQLSRKRVEAVRTFLTFRGVRPAQIVTTFTGENLSSSRIADDERDRAVEALFEASTGPARFERVTMVEALDGFHGKRNPQEMVLGSPDISFVRLLGGRGSVVESLAPGVVRVSDPSQPSVTPVMATSDNMLLQLHPGLPGRAQLVAQLPGLAPVSLSSRSLALIRPDEQLPNPNPRPLTPRLRLLAVAPKTVTVSFHYVKGAPQGSARVTTARQPDAKFEQDLIDVINRIYVGQTRILFFRLTQRTVTTSFKGPITTGSDQILADPQTTNNIDTNARIRVFFVEMLDNSPGPDAFAHTVRPLRPLGQPGEAVTIRDSLDPKPGGSLLTDPGIVGSVLAHECGHCFGIEHDTRSDQHLMHEKNKGGIIPLDTAEEMHKNVFLKKP